MQRVNVAQDRVGHDDVLEQLKSFCRGEMSAVETYRQAIEATREAWIVAQLRENLASHQHRVELLRTRIVALGGEPPDSSGPWGTFAKAMEGAAATFGEKSALSLLEQGEDHGLNDYRADLGNLDAESLRLVRDVILPQQMQTHRVLSDIKHQLP